MLGQQCFKGKYVVRYVSKKIGPLRNKVEICEKNMFQITIQDLISKSVTVFFIPRD